MQITIELDVEKGDRIIRFGKISNTGQMSGMKEYAGSDAVVMVYHKKKSGKHDRNGKHQ